MDSTSNDFAIYFAKLMQECPELEQIIYTWPALPEDTKKEILEIIQQTG